MAAQTKKPIHGNEKVVCDDAGYTCADKREKLNDKRVRWDIAKRCSRIKALSEGELKQVSEFIDHLAAKVRARVECPLQLLKRIVQTFPNAEVSCHITGYTKLRRASMFRHHHVIE